MGAGNLPAMPPWARALLESSAHAYLGLLDASGAPRVLPVTFAIAGGEVVSAVDHKPKRRPDRELARVRWLRRDPRAALTVDRYDDDWSRLAWVQLLGRVRIVDTVDAETLAALRDRYAPYRDRPPAGPVLRLHPERALCWRATG
jgi:PPOX class probable F420-dependent enzyme